MSDSMMSTLTYIISIRETVYILFFLMNEEIESVHLIFPSSQLLVTGGATQV